MFTALLLLACSHPSAVLPTATGSVPTAQSQPGLPQWGSLDTGPPSVRFDETVDVLVVGSGPAGMAAALAARDAGASVLILERADTSATGVVSGSILFAAGTAEQAAAGITDSPEFAAEEWPQITGVPGDTQAVSTFLQNSAPNLAWLESMGAVVMDLEADHDAGTVARLHTLQGTNTRAVLLAAYDGELRTDAEVTAPILNDGRVVGAVWRDTQTGAIGTVRAGAVVIATGGFLRDRDAVDAARPELAGRDLLFETSPYSTGGGLPFLDAVGAGQQNIAHLGLYVHSFQDPYYPPGESLRLGGPLNFLLVGEDGQRFADETMTYSLDLFDELPDGDVYAVFPDSYADSFTAARPGYLWATPDVPEEYALSDLTTVSDQITVAASESELASALGVDPEGFASAITEVNAAIASGHIDRFGRTFGTWDPLEDGIWWGVHLLPGLAKQYGGVSTDVDTHVLTSDDEPVPGLYAAGEVAGMIPEGGAGEGFSGSVNACYVFGRIAGANAAAEALAEGE